MHDGLLCNYEFDNICILLTVRSARHNVIVQMPIGYRDLAIVLQHLRLLAYVMREDAVIAISTKGQILYL